MSRKWFISLTLVWWLTSNGWCDIIYIKGGGFFEGEVIEETEGEIKFLAPRIGTLTLNKSDIERISKEEKPANVLDTYMKRKNEIEGCDAQVHYELGEYCLSNGLYGYADVEFKSAAGCDEGYKSRADEGLRQIGLHKKFDEARYLAGIRSYSKSRRLLNEITETNPSSELKEEVRTLLSRIEKAEEYVPPLSVRKEVEPEPQKDISLVRSIGSLVRLINQAEDSVYCGAFSIDNLSIFNALVEARLRGIEVKVLIGKGNLKSGMVQLKNLGADVKEIAGPQDVANLFFIIDDMFLWLSPYGLATQNQLMEKESALLIRYPPLVKAYNLAYAQLYTGSNRFDIQERNEFITEDLYLENYFTPDVKVKRRLFEELNKSLESIFFCTPRFEDKQLRKIFLQKAKAGVEIEGIFEQQYKNPVYETMKKSGLIVHLNSKPYNIFSTILILDRRVLVMGSFTLEKEFWEIPNQNLLFIYDRELAGNFYAECKEFF